MVGVAISPEGWPQVERNVRIENCIFYDNHLSTSKSSGAAMKIMHAMNVTIENCSFSNNYAAAGGALDVMSSSVSLRETTFSLNFTGYLTCPWPTGPANCY